MSSLAAECAFIIKEGSTIPETETVDAFMILLLYTAVGTSIYRSVNFSQPLSKGFSLITTCSIAKLPIPPPLSPSPSPFRKDRKGIGWIIVECVWYLSPYSSYQSTFCTVLV